jgi:hypothetical protein
LRVVPTIANRVPRRSIMDAMSSDAITLRGCGHCSD